DRVVEQRAHDRDRFSSVRRLAIMANVDNPSVMLDIGEVRAAAGALGLEAAISEIRRAEDIAPAIEALQGRAEALYAAGDPLVTTNRNRLGILAVGARLPTMARRGRAATEQAHSTGRPGADPQQPGGNSPV